MCTNNHIFTVLLINNLVNQDGEPRAPHNLATGTKPLVSNERILFYPCVVQKSTAHVNINALNIRHQSQKGFGVIFVGIPQNQIGYLIYVISTQKIPHMALFLTKNF